MQGDEPKIDWNGLLTFLKQEVEQSDVRGYPPTLRRLIQLLHGLGQECSIIVQHLQDPENRIHKVCAYCNNGFSHPDIWVTTCSVECHEKWLKNPQGFSDEDSTIGSTVWMLQRMELEKKAQQ